MAERPRGGAPFSADHIKGACYPHDFLLMALPIAPWPRSCLSGVSSVQLPFPLPCCWCCDLWREVTVRGPHLGSGELCSMSWRAECLHKLFGILLDRKIVYFPPYVSLFSMIYTVYTHGYSFCSVGSHMIVLHFVAPTVPAWAIRKLSLLAPMSLCHTPILEGFSFFLAPWSY